MKIGVMYDAANVTFYYVQGSDTEQLHRILLHQLPDVMEKFAAKNAQYGENEFELGVAGQFPEIWRKVKLLQSRIWAVEEGPKPQEWFDGNEDVISDLIGHLLMLLDCLQHYKGPQDAQEQHYQGPIPPVEPFDKPAPPNYHPSYMVAELWATAGGWRLPIAPTDDQRCGWYHGDRTTGANWRCLGYKDHEERAHINQNGDAWTS